MPGFNDIIDIAQALEKQPVLVRAEKCSKVRNRNSSCTRCVDACPVKDVIVIEKNQLNLDAARCSRCGACTTVCPTEALVPLDPADVMLGEQLAQSCLLLGGRFAVIGCARISAKGQADPRKFAEVPCLCRVDESIVAGLALHGVERLVLVDGDCTTCRYRDTCRVADRVCSQLEDLFDAFGINFTLQRTSEFPDECLLEDTRGLLGQSRREFFSRGRDTAKDAAAKTAIKKLNLEAQAPTLREMLSVGSGKMAQFSVARRITLLDALEGAGSPSDTVVETSLWGNVEIDTEACNGCGMCAVFCPTGALVKAENEDASDKTITLEFRCADCVACGLCADACFKKCLAVSSSVKVDDLLDFEPRIVLSQLPGKTSSLLG